MIIEDEVPARNRLRKMLDEMATSIEIVGEADTGKDAINQIEKQRPDVLFLDIQLPDINGFVVLQQLTYQPMIVFVTAYEEYAIKAFESYAIDYLIKPIQIDRFKKCIEKITQYIGHIPQPDHKVLQQLINATKKKMTSTSFAVKKDDRIILLYFEDIVYIQAEDKYLRIYTSNGKKYLSEGSLKGTEETMPDFLFRAHRSTIINRNFIKEIRKYFKGKLIIILDLPGEPSVTTGETYSIKVKKILGI